MGSIAVLFKAVLLPYLLLNLSSLHNNLLCRTIAVCCVLFHDPSNLESCPQLSFTQEILEDCKMHAY